MEAGELIRQLRNGDTTKEVVVFSYRDGIYYKEEVVNVVEDFNISGEWISGVKLKQPISQDLKIVGIVTNQKMKLQGKVKIRLDSGLDQGNGMKYRIDWLDWRIILVCTACYYAGFLIGMIS